jgi:MFS transporter, ACS family, glucarate transporter
VFVTAFYVGYVTSNAISGFFVDRFGGRLMLMLGAVLPGLFTYCFSYVRSVGAGIVLQALMGLAAGVDYAACIKLITAWFGIRDRGRALGLFLTATSRSASRANRRILGVVTTNLIVPALLKDFGWGGVYEGLGAMTMAWGVIIFLVLRDARRVRQEGASKSRLSRCSSVTATCFFSPPPGSGRCGVLGASHSGPTLFWSRATASPSKRPA